MAKNDKFLVKCIRKQTGDEEHLFFETREEVEKIKIQRPSTSWGLQIYEIKWINI